MQTLTKLLTGALFVVGINIALTAPLPAQGGSIDLPSLRASEIFIRNPTNGSIAFSLESANAERTQFTLGPGQSSTYSGADGDTWINVFVNSDGGNHSYGLDIGKRVYFKWVGNDLQLFDLEN